MSRTIRHTAAADVETVRDGRQVRTIRRRNSLPRRTATKGAALAAILAEYGDTLPALTRTPRGTVELRGADERHAVVSA